MITRKTLDAVAGLVRDLEREPGVPGTVVASIPGTVSHATGRIKNANSTWLNGTLLSDDLSRMLERLIRLANDANCFALSEATDGAGAGAGVVFGSLITGTGMGAGLVVNGRVMVGATAWRGSGDTACARPRALTANHPARRAIAGVAGASETWLSGPALAARFRRQDGRSRRWDGPVAQEIAELRRGRRSAGPRTRVDRHHTRTASPARSAALINILDPDVVVLGGGLSNLPGLAERASEAMRPVCSDSVSVRRSSRERSRRFELRRPRGGLALGRGGGLA